MTSNERRVDYKELIPEIRQQIKQKYQNDPDKYDQQDIEKIEKEEWPVLRYIKYNRGNVNKCVEQLNQTLRWRHEFGVNSLEENELPNEFIKVGALFPLGSEHSEKIILYIRAKVYKKVPQLQDIFRKFVVGVIERVDRNAGPKGYHLVFDLTGLGFSNADMDFLQFLTNTFRNYFPYGLRSVIVYNLPRILRPLWAVARLWMGDHDKFIRFVSGDEIKEIVPAESLPLYMGGSAKFDFTVAPDGCKSVKDLAPKYGFSDTEVDKYMKIFEPHMKEAQQLVLGIKCY